MERRHDGGLSLHAGDAGHQRLPDLAEVQASMKADEAVHELHRCAVGHVRHLVIRNDPAHDALGSVAVAELVPRLDRMRVIKALCTRLADEDAVLKGVRSP